MVDSVLPGEWDLQYTLNLKLTSFTEATDAVSGSCARAASGVMDQCDGVPTAQKRGRSPERDGDDAVGCQPLQGMITNANNGGVKRDARVEQACRWCIVGSASVATAAAGPAAAAAAAAAWPNGWEAERDYLLVAAMDDQTVELYHSAAHIRLRGKDMVVGDDEGDRAAGGST